MSSKKHIHKYHRVDTDAGPLWACALYECSHFMPAHYVKLLPGKGSICWGCQATFMLNELNMKDSQPLCTECMVERTLATLTSDDPVDTDEDIP